MRAFAVLVALVMVPTMALAQWSDNFDSYALNSQIVGQGGWEEWGAGAGALVVDTQSQSAPHSVEIVGGSDLVHQYTESTGKWFYDAWQYIPSSMTGITYFIMQNTYNYPSGPYFWSVQVGFDSASGNIMADCGSSNQVTNVRFKTNQWVLIRVYIDFDNDWTATYYNGQILDDPLLPDHPTLGGGYQWSMGVFGAGGGVNAIGAVDLFANAATEIYYDDMSFQPATIWADVKVNGTDGNIDITVGQNAAISIAFVAGDEYQNDGDVWVALLTPLGGQFAKLTYDGVGGIGGTGFHPGLGNALASGPLGNHWAMALDWTMGNAMQGDFNAILAADGIANGIPDIGSLLIIDSAPFTVVGQ